MGEKAGCKRINVNVPVEELETLKERAGADNVPVSSVINADIAKENKEFKDTQTV